MLTFNLENPASCTINVTEQKVNNYKMYTLNYPCPSSTSCTPYTTTLPTGKYKFEVFGAGGGTSDLYYQKGGMGGLSIGYFEVTSPILAYFYIGGKGSGGPEYYSQYINPPGGYNGGGNGGYWAGGNTGGRAGGGGGSSDIRISSNDISMRIIVAGGGGGGCINTDSAGNGGGISSTAGIPGHSSYSKEGGPGTESSGGYTQGSGGATAGRPLYGGNGGTYPSSNGCGGGGGGYFGGGGGCSINTYCASGGGGSGYIGGVQSSSKYSITASTTTYTNTGNGFIKITVLESKYSIFTIDPYVYSIPLLYLHVFVLLDHPLSKL